MRRLIIAAALAVLLVPTAGFAQTSLAAYDAVHEALLAVWDELPLSVRDVTLTTDAAEGFGRYNARPGSSFAPGDDILVYAEALGYGATANADGTFTRRLSADLTLLDGSGAVRASQKGFWVSDITTRQRVLETYLSFSATLSTFEPGDYTLNYTLHDLASGKETSFEVPITLTAAP
jgi:hypothetical protein